MIKIYLMSVEPLWNDDIYKAACDRLDASRLEKVKEAKRTEDKILRVGAGLLLQYAVQKGPVFEYGTDMELRDEVLRCTEVSVDEILMGIREPIEFQFTYGPHGKPYFSENYLGENADLFFSLSHSGNYVLCALAHEEVGADIQKIPEVEMKKTERERNIAERFFAKRERLWYQDAGEEVCRERFYRIWAGKEAYIKWTGNGLTEGLSSFEVDPDKGMVNNGEALLWELEVPCGYVAAICKKEGL